MLQVNTFDAKNAHPKYFCWFSTIGVSFVVQYIQASCHGGHFLSRDKKRIMKYAKKSFLCLNDTNSLTQTQFICPS